MNLDELEKFDKKLVEDLRILKKLELIKLLYDKFVTTGEFHRFKYQVLENLYSKAYSVHYYQFLRGIFVSSPRYVSYKILSEKLASFKTSVSSGKKGTPRIPKGSKKKAGLPSTFWDIMKPDQIRNVLIGKDMKIHRVKLKSKSKKFYLDPKSSAFRKLSERSSRDTDPEGKVWRLVTQSFNLGISKSGYVELFVLCAMHLFTSRFDLDFPFLDDKEKQQLIDALNDNEAEVAVPILQGAEQLKDAKVKLNRPPQIAEQAHAISAWVDESRGYPEIDIRSDLKTALNLARLLAEPKLVLDFELEMRNKMAEVLSELDKVKLLLQIFLPEV